MPTVPFLMKQTRSVKLFTKIPTQFILPLRLLLCDKSDDFYSDLTPPPFFFCGRSRARENVQIVNLGHCDACLRKWTTLVAMAA